MGLPSVVCCARVGLSPLTPATTRAVSHRLLVDWRPLCEFGLPAADILCGNYMVGVHGRKNRTCSRPSTDGQNSPGRSYGATFFEVPGHAASRVASDCSSHSRGLSHRRSIEDSAGPVCRAILGCGLHCWTGYSSIPNSSCMRQVSRPTSSHRSKQSIEHRARRSPNGGPPPNKAVQRSSNSFVQLASVAVWRHTSEAGSGPVSAVAGR